jgi:hypothetical protein
MRAFLIDDTERQIILPSLLRSLALNYMFAYAQTISLYLARCL